MISHPTGCCVYSVPISQLEGISRSYRRSFPSVFCPAERSKASLVNQHRFDCMSAPVKLTDSSSHPTIKENFKLRYKIPNAKIIHFASVKKSTNWVEYIRWESEYQLSTSAQLPVGERAPTVDSERSTTVDIHKLTADLIEFSRKDVLSPLLYVHYFAKRTNSRHPSLLNWWLTGAHGGANNGEDENLQLQHFPQRILTVVGSGER